MILFFLIIHIVGIYFHILENSRFMSSFCKCYMCEMLYLLPINTAGEFTALPLDVSIVI